MGLWVKGEGAHSAFLSDLHLLQEGLEHLQGLTVSTHSCCVRGGSCSLPEAGLAFACHHLQGLMCEERESDRNVQRFRGGLVFKAHRRLYHSTLGLRVIKRRRREKITCEGRARDLVRHSAPPAVDTCQVASVTVTGVPRS